MPSSFVEQNRGPVIELVRVRVGQRVLVFRLLEPAANSDVRHGLHEELDADHLGELGLSRAITSCTDGRSLKGFSWVNTRAVFSLGLPPVAPAKPTTPETAGSLRMMAANSFSIFAIASKAMSSRACAAPIIMPVSCSGKNPFGITT